MADALPSAPESTEVKPRAEPADEAAMRALLEYLGLLEPERGRRDPIALPSWAPAALVGAIVVVALFGVMWLRALLHLLFA